MPQPPIIRHSKIRDRSLKEIKAFLSPHQKMVWCGKTEYKNSGKMTANAIKAAFSKFSNTTYISENCTGRECFNRSYQRKVHLLRAARNPTLVGPSHRGSGIPDNIEIKISTILSSRPRLLPSIITDCYIRVFLKRGHFALLSSDKLRS